MSPRAVFVDLDGTLIPPPSSEVRLARHLLRRGLLGPRQLGAWFAFLLAHARLGRHALRLDKAWLAGLEVAAVAEAAETLAGRELLAALRPAVRARLERHLAAGDRVVLLTGAPQAIAASLAAHLGLAAAIGSLCAARGGRYAAAAPLRHPFGRAKRILAAAWCGQAGFDLGRAVAYADSRHDLPLLEAVGEPVAVAPDRALAARARARGWAVIG